jgi:hypothetical protein
MSTQYRLVQSGKTASGGCSAGPRFVRASSATDLFIYNWATFSMCYVLHGTLKQYRILFICGVFNDAVSSSDYIALNDAMIYE